MAEILIVEDNAANMRLARLLLTSAGATRGASCSAIILPRCSSWDCNSFCCSQVK